MSADEGNDEELAGGSESKKGRKAKLVYGVNSQKFYATSTNNISIEALKHAAKIESFEERKCFKGKQTCSDENYQVFLLF